MASLDLLPGTEGLVFDEQEHLYYIDHLHLGRVVIPSATQVMQATGAKTMDYSSWRRSLMRRQGLTEEEANEHMTAHCRARAQVGTHFHLFAQTHLSEGPVIFAQSYMAEPWQMYLLWRKEFAPRLGRVRLLEAPLVHRACLYAGTPDLLAEVDGVPTLIDWKTQQTGREKKRPEWQLQMGAYWELIRHSHRITPGRGLNLIVTATGLREVWWNLADLKQGWLHYASYLADFHEERDGDPHRLALQAMEPMF